MKRTVCFVVVCGLLGLFTGCQHLIIPGGKVPPGQVKKRTGYNPASGKIHTTGAKKKK